MEIVHTAVTPPPAPTYPRLRNPLADDSKASRNDARFLRRPRDLGFGGRGVRPPRLSSDPPQSLERAFERAIHYQSSKDSILNMDVTQPLLNTRSPYLSRGKSNIRAREGVEFDLDGSHLTAQTLDADQTAGILNVQGDVNIVRLNSHIAADSFFLQRKPLAEIAERNKHRYRILPHGYDPYAVSKLGDGVLEAHNFHLKEPGRSFDADYIRYDSVLHNGEMTYVKGYTDPFYFSAKKIRILDAGSFELEDCWITTCDLEEPHYRVHFSKAKIEEGQLVVGKKAKMQFGKKARTYLYIPKIADLLVTGEHKTRLELELGQESTIGTYVNIAQWYRMTPNVEMAYRFYPSTNEGLGFGIDAEYDYTDNPASHWFRSTGKFETFYTGSERGFTQWYHQQELSPNLRLLGQVEQWYDEDVIKDFYRDDFEDRTGPRTFGNLTYLRDGSIITGTTSKSTHDFISETEKLPEATYHLLERSFGKGFYATLDTVAGSYRKSATDIEAQRTSQVARLSYDLNLMRGMNVTPFVEGSLTHYSQTLESDSSDSRVSNLAGINSQLRLQRSYRGRGKFAGFKHIFMPSVTYFDENSTSMDINEVPRFDAIENRPSRERVESKIDNIILGRNLLDNQVWRVAKVTLYQGQDLSNEIARTTDYEVDIEIRPRPAWGLRVIADQHDVENGAPAAEEGFDRILSFIFYDDAQFKNLVNARVGYSSVDYGNDRLSRHVLYGVGYRISDKWSVSADHSYNIDTNELSGQSYRIRRRLHKWQMGVSVGHRASGTDFKFVMSLVDITGTSLGL